MEAAICAAFSGMPLRKAAHELNQRLDRPDRTAIVHACPNTTDRAMTFQTTKTSRRRFRQKHRFESFISTSPSDVHHRTRANLSMWNPEISPVELAIQKGRLSPIPSDRSSQSAVLLKPFENAVENEYPEGVWSVE